MCPSRARPNRPYRHNCWGFWENCSGGLCSVSMRAHSPPLQGGVAAASIKSREATEEPQTGWSLTRHVSQTHSEASLVSDHPVRAFFRNGSIFLMARPPLLCQDGKVPKLIHGVLSKLH